MSLTADARIFVLLVLPIALLLSGSGPASALTMTFENFAVPPSASVPIANPFSSAGYLLEAPGGDLFVDGPAVPSRSSNGSNSLVARRTGSGFVDLRIQTQGGSFDLVQLDLAEILIPGVGDPALTALSIEVFGALLGGGIVQRQIVLDNISDGQGGAADFQTFIFDNTWTNLSTVLLRGTSTGPGSVYMKIDNVELETTTVPEPSTALLLGLGCALASGARRRSSRRPVG